MWLFLATATHTCIVVKELRFFFFLCKNSPEGVLNYLEGAILTLGVQFQKLNLRLILYWISFDVQQSQHWAILTLRKRGCGGYQRIDRKVIQK